MRDSGFELAVTQPFRFRQCLEYMTRSPLECLYEVDGERVVRLVKVDGSGTVAGAAAGAGSGAVAGEWTGAVVSAAAGVPAGTLAGEDGSECGSSGANGSMLLEITCPDDQALQVTFLQGGPQNEEELAQVKTYVREWFDLDRDLAPWQRMAEADPVLGKLARDMYGLRLIGIPDLFEALCWAIVGQQVNLAFAYTLKRRLTEAYGEAAVREGRTYRRFPEPAAVAGADLHELQALQLTKAKAAAIREVAALMERGELSRVALLALGDYDAAERELVRVRGIGPWTAHYVRMRCLRDPRAFPIGDVGLHNAVKAQLGLERKPTPQELQALFMNWAGWEAYATFYLWHSLY